MNQRHVVLIFFLLLCVACRVWVWYGSNTTLEDALITFRYVENIAAGEGFVFNKNERVMGTTTPSWTLLLSATSLLGSRNIIVTSKVIGILLDTATLALLFSVLSSYNFSLSCIFAALFASSASIASITVSGMETPLVLFAMTLAFAGLVRTNILFGVGIAVLILTRIDAIIFAGILMAFSLLKDRVWTLKQLAIIVVACLPWFVFSLLYFGSVLPQSALAKSAVYNVDIRTNLQQLLAQFSSFNETGTLKFIVKSIVFLSMLAGIAVIIRTWKQLLPFALFFLVYCTALALSGVLIFRWYLIPAILASYILIATGVTWLVEMNPSVRPIRRTGLLVSVVLALCIAQTIQLKGHIDRLAALQDFEENVRTKIGLWLKNNAGGSTVFLEPLGYIGYYAGINVTLMDEIGLVTPAVLPYRAPGDGWYVPALRALKPDYVVQYAYVLQNNTSEGTGQKLFSTEGDKRWFDDHFLEVTTFDATSAYPSLEAKEKKYVVFRKR